MGRALGHCGTPHTHIVLSCLLQTYTEEERIIITQLPFPTTLVDFWALVWDYTCTSVVVLNDVQELDKVSSPSSDSSPLSWFPVGPSSVISAFGPARILP